MERYLDLYQEDLLYVFQSSQTTNHKPLIIIKDEASIMENNDYTTMHYSDNWQSLLLFSVPTKMRKTKQLLSYQESLQLIQEIPYGVLSISKDNIPYSVALNHVLLDGKLYFHTAKSGYKKNGIDHPVQYLIIQDLGINEAMATHNHKSVAVQGILRSVKEKDIKQQVLQKLMKDLAPSNHKTITAQQVENTEILEIEIQYIIGKVHIR